MIVHGRTNLLTEVIAKLVLKGFKDENIQMARLDMAGNVGDYVAMVWPPGRPQEIIVRQIGESKVAQATLLRQVVGKMCNKMNFIEYP
jgi:hypothetical protein